VLFTDGEDQGSHTTRDGALEAAERAEAMIYSVLVADPLFCWARGRDFKGEAALAALQGETGGSMIRPETGDGLQEVASELRAQYRLGYVPRKARYDGSFRRLEVPPLATPQRRFEGGDPRGDPGQPQRHLAARRARPGCSQILAGDTVCVGPEAIRFVAGGTEASTLADTD
jgi:hypothetical protein